MSSLVYITVHVPEAGKAVDYPSSQFTRDFSAFPFFSLIGAFFQSPEPLIDPQSTHLEISWG